MTTGPTDVLPVLGGLLPGGDVRSLANVGAEIGLSPTHAQRVFARIIGESPARYRHRLQMEFGAAMLLSSDRPVIDVALAVGFESHEAFTRAFRRHFSATPTAYRRRAPAPLTSEQAELVASVGPCVALATATRATRPDPKTANGEPMNHEIEQTTMSPTPVLYIPSRVDRDNVADALAQSLPAVYGYVMEAGLAMAGPPYVRHVDASPAFITLEAGIPLAAPAPAPGGDTPIEAGELPGGEMAVTVHHGPYDTLAEAHIALDRWMAENGRSPAGGPWEVYLTDPAEVPDPADWRTQVVWPLR